MFGSSFYANMLGLLHTMPYTVLRMLTTDRRIVCMAYSCSSVSAHIY